jgi:hypothetical protein
VRRLLLIVLVSCGTKSSSPTLPPPPPPPDASADASVTADAAPVAGGPLDRDLPRLAARSVALYEAVVATFRAAGTDCAAAAKQLTALRAEYADVTAANAKVLHEGRARELKAALVKYDDKLDAAAREIVGSQTISKCTSDRIFTKAFDELVGAPP